ncbi:MAG: hypothetical protein LBQ31_03745 [Bacteroidales bacterium]|jgi:hypothetical protein|nr:hypothetical protein [Bacteroidales bacterium]
MKQLILLASAVAICLCATSCRTQTHYASTGHVATNTSEGVVTVRSTGTGATKKKAITNAEHKAFDILFFRGLPESAQKRPMIGSNEESEKSKNRKWFNEFYESRYQTFIISSVPVGNATTNRTNETQITMEVKINLNALRRDLEGYGVIRKFGY